MLSQSFELVQTQAEGVGIFPSLVNCSGDGLLIGNENDRASVVLQQSNKDNPTL